MGLSPVLVMASVAQGIGIQRVQHGQHGCSFHTGGHGIHHPVVSALHGGSSGNLALIGGHPGKSTAHEVQALRRRTNRWSANRSLSGSPWAQHRQPLCYTGCCAHRWQTDAPAYGPPQGKDTVPGWGASFGYPRCGFHPAGHPAGDRYIPGCSLVWSTQKLAIRSMTLSSVRHGLHHTTGAIHRDNHAILEGTGWHWWHRRSRPCPGSDRQWRSGCWCRLPR